MAFTCLIRRHEASVFRLIYRFFGKEDVANDLAQEVFLRVWRHSDHSGKYVPTAKFTTWLYTVTANCCRSEAQSLWRRNIRLIGSFWTARDTAAPEFPEPIAPPPSPEDALLQAEQRQLVQAASGHCPTTSDWPWCSSDMKNCPTRKLRPFWTARSLPWMPLRQQSASRLSQALDFYRFLRH